MSSEILGNQSSNVENVNADVPQSKRIENTSQRVALKPINQNVSRVQPFRAAKQNATKEGFFSKGSSNCPVIGKSSHTVFRIYDENEKVESKKKSTENTATSTKLTLHPAIISLPRVPLNTLYKHASTTPQESPLMMDVSEEERLNIFDIDNEEGVYGFSEYAVDIFEHLKEAELLHRPKLNYMRKQQDITSAMRSILVDWLIEVAEEYRLHNETIHLAVNYIDRFLSQMAVLRGKLQLVGAAAMFIAGKFEEIYPPDVGEYVYITDDTYTKKQVLRMEHLILKVLNFEVAVPTSNQFLKRFLKAAKADDKTEFLAQYLCELALLHLDCIQYIPSMLAASAVCLASFSICGKIWDDTMEYYMKYKLEELMPCVQKLRDLLQAAESLLQRAIPEKYKDAKYGRVASLPLPPALPTDEAPSEKAS